MKRIAILGSTGSIGTQAIDVISLRPEEFQIEALTAGHNIELLLQQAQKYQPKVISVATKDLADRIKPLLPSTTKVYYGEQGLYEAAAVSEADFVISALVGSQGLKPTLAAIEAGKTIGLANKETLVSAGHIVTKLAAKHKAPIIPIDSEHSAIFQCLNGESRSEISKIIITASGGSFRDRSRHELEGVTVKEALNHPNWSMGAKITIDSATMVNKGLEVIEAHWLFQLPYDQIDVLLHPQSIIHSLVEFVDSSVIAQLGNPDMRVPIQYALSYPHRWEAPAEKLSLEQIGRLDFKAMDYERYPCLRMAYECGTIGGSLPAVFNAANEIAVARFLQGEISFLQIEQVIYDRIEAHQVIKSPSIEEIYSIDLETRRLASL